MNAERNNDIYWIPTSRITSILKELRAKHALVVDDDEAVLDLTRELLLRGGFEVVTARGGREALEILRVDAERKIDAAVLDLAMPGMDGIETLRRIKEEDPELQVILLTGHASLEKGIEAMKFGAMDFLEKPARIQELMEKIEQAKAKRMLVVERQMEEKLKDILQSKGW